MGPKKAMNKKCGKCGNRELPIVANKLCQRCISRIREDKLEEEGKTLIFRADYLIDNYILSKESIRSIAIRHKISVYAVRKHLTDFRIPIRSNKEALSKSFKEDIFCNLTVKGAFLLGYIYTDGDFLFNENAKTHFLRIYSKHEEQIEKVKTILETDATIQHREQKNYGNVVQGEIFFMHIANKSIISDLLDLGLTIFKNKDVKFPLIPDNLKHHFIRGCWAGSGNVYESKNGVHSSIIIGSLPFMTEIENYLNKNGLKKRAIYKLKNSKSSSYKIRYAHKESEKLYNFLYRGKTNLTVSSKQEKMYEQNFKSEENFQNELLFDLL